MNSGIVKLVDIGSSTTSNRL